jgi:hypothetical protein
VIAHLDAACENRTSASSRITPLARIQRSRPLHAAARHCRAFNCQANRVKRGWPLFEHWSDIVRSAIRWAGGGDVVRPWQRSPMTIRRESVTPPF